MRFVLTLITLFSINSFADTLRIPAHGACSIIAAFGNGTNPKATGTTVPVILRYPVIIDPSNEHAQSQQAKALAKSDDKTISMESEMKFDSKEGFHILGRIMIDGKEVKHGEITKEVAAISPRRIATSVIMTPEESKAAGLKEFSGQELQDIGAPNITATDSYYFAGFATNCVIQEPKN